MAERATGPGLPDDTRGIIDPAAMLQLVDFQRHPVGDVLDGLVDWFWSVSWRLPDDRVHEQQVLNHPSGHISIGTLDDAGVPLDPPQGRVYGVLTGISHRRLTASGWTVAAKTTVGGLGVFLNRPARIAVDRQLDLTDALPGLAPPTLVSDVAAAGGGAVGGGAVGGNDARVAVLRAALEDLVAQRDDALVAEARHVVSVAAAAEHDRTICRVEQLAALSGSSVRTLQRLFDLHVGVGPSFVIRRWRIIEAAEAAARASSRGQQWRGWAAVAAELGYADQAHLTRDFRRHLGTSPAAYVARNGQLV